MAPGRLPTSSASPSFGVRHARVCATVLILWCAPGSATPMVAAARACAHVGETRREFADPQRRNWLGTGPRPLRTVVWHPAAPPAASGTSAEPCAGGDVHVHADASFGRDRERFPLVLLSHGSGGDAEQMRWLGLALAGHGFIAAAINHNGTDEEELGGILSATDFFAWERPRDVSVVLDALLDDARLAPRIEADRIGAAGFSAGATTVLWLGGARLDLELLRTQSPPPPPFLQDAINQLIAYSTDNDVGRAAIARAGRSYRDTRIQCIFALAPAMGPGFTEESLRAVDVPVFLVVGAADVVTPPAANAERFARHIPEARLTLLAGERGHYTRYIAPAQRRAELEEVSALARAFFDESLRGP